MIGGANSSAGAPVTGCYGRTSRGGAKNFLEIDVRMYAFLRFLIGHRSLFDPQFCYKLKNYQVLEYMNS